jgi:hypothetical protein
VEIPTDSEESPIKEYFRNKKIVWTFGDYYITSCGPPHKGFVGLAEKIVEYGGYVNIMVVFTNEKYTSPYGNEIRNYSVVDDFGWSQESINKSLEFFDKPNISPQCHGWNHSEELNNANLSYAHKLINFTLWNWNNNFGIKPNFFLGHSTGGNYNITLALKHFSERYWNVYGEMFRWDNKDLFPSQSKDGPAVDYIDWSFDPLFGCGWGNPCKTVEEAVERFDEYYASHDVIFMRGHPNILNGTDTSAIENLTKWNDFIDRIYQDYDLININHTEALKYRVDKNNFKVQKIEESESIRYVIDLTSCKYDHNITLTNPYGTNNAVWKIYNENGDEIGQFSDYFPLILEGGTKYYLETEGHESDRNQKAFLTNDIIIFFVAIIVIIFLIVAIIAKKVL